MILVPLGRCGADDLLVKIRGGRRPHPAQDTDDPRALHGPFSRGATLRPGIPLTSSPLASSAIG